MAQTLCLERAAIYLTFALEKNEKLSNMLNFCWLSNMINVLLFVFIVFYCSQMNTERAIRHAIQERLPIVVVINKVNVFMYFFFLFVNFGLLALIT